MEKVDDCSNAIPISRNDMDDGRSNILDWDDTSNPKNETLNDLQDSDVDMKAVSQRKRAYTCKRCGKPLKGHTCDANPISLPSYFLMPSKRRRAKKRQFNIEGEVTIQEQFPTTTETNNSTAPIIGEIKESIWDTGKESIADQSRNWYDDYDDDDHDGHEIERTAVNQRPTQRKRTIQLESSSEDENNTHDVDDVVSLSQSSSKKRSYTCRLCGVPRKGHYCPFVADGNCKRQAEQQPLLSTQTANHNIKNRRKSGNILESVSVMERIEYNSRSDSNDDDDDDEDRVPSTELLIPAHVFLDEIHSYIMEQLHQRQAEKVKQLPINTKKSMEIEKESLQTWATNVYTKFEKLNEQGYNEMQRASKQKQLEQSITKERDMIMILNRKIRCIQNDCRTITDHVLSLRKEHNRNIATSQFLSAIDAIRDK